MNRRDGAILAKILNYCTETKEAHSFFYDNKDLFMDEIKGAIYRNAVAMPILQIGELAKNLSEECRSEYKQVPWKEMIRMRDLFAHHYGALDYEQLWDTSHGDIEELHKQLTT